jgi:rhodanese-related sulfurtransferase
MKTIRILASLLAFTASSILGQAPAPSNTIEVTPEQAEKLLKDKPKILILDVRTADEFKDGHIPGAKNVDFLGDDFARQVAALDPATPILVHCAAGGRSARALASLKGKHTVYHLKEGFSGWAKAGKPVER